MKKLSKITAVLVAAIMLVLSMSVTAAVIESVPSELLFTQDFAGLSAFPDGWEVKKNGKVDGVDTTEAFNSLGLTTNQKNNLWVGNNTPFDAGSIGYTVEYSFSKMSSGSMNVVIGGDQEWYKPMTGYAVQSQSANNLVPSAAGYTIQFQHVSAADSLTVYKNGSPIIQKRIDTELLNSSGKGSGSVGGLKTYDVKLEVTGTKTILTVDAHASADYTGVFEYEDTNPVTSGYVGAYFASTTPSSDGSTGTLFDISISSNPSTKSTDNFFFHKVFSGSDTAESVADLGFNVTEASSYYPIVPTESGLQLLASGYGKSEIILDDYVFDGTYNIKSSVVFSYNSYSYYLNYQDESNYYRLVLGSINESGTITFSGYILYKCTEGVETELARQNYADINKYMFWKDATPVEITVKNETGKTTIDVTGYKNNSAYEWSYTDEASPISSGKFGIITTSSGESYLKSIKIYSSEPAYTSGSKTGEDVVLSLPYMPWKSDSTNVITAVYSADVTKDFVNASIKTFADFENGSAVVVPGSENAAGTEIRTFIWDNLENMRPLTSPIVVKPEA